MRICRIVVILILGVFLSYCGEKQSIDELLTREMQSRRSEPALFKLNGKNFSKKKFNEYNFRKNVYFEKGNPIENPEEIKAAINSYLNEIILSNNVISKLNFKSQEYNDFMMPYLIQGTINYYFYKEAGIIAEMYNASYSEKLKGAIMEELSKNGKKRPTNAEENALIENIIRWRKIQKYKESETYIKRDILSKLKSENKVIILNQ